MKFELLGLNPEILRAVEKKGYKRATAIQEKSIPAVLSGKDVLGGAQTGTGKTAAFALPILHNLHERGRKSKTPQALILTPTRELAEQVGDSFIDYGKFLGLKTVKIYGGVKINPQITSLKEGTDIIVATPGRLIDHINQNTINLREIEILVLDEADRMLDMGFIRDIQRIIKALPRSRQNLLFSATYGKDIKQLSSDVLVNPVFVEVTKRNTAAEKVDQIIYRIEKGQKRHLLAHLIQAEAWYQVLVFVRTRHGANRLARQLDKSGIPATAIHSDKSQAARTRAMKSFKKGDLQVLVATDVAARGIDLQDLTHVVNFELPQVPEDYVHRIGRTGRAGKSGTAISLISNEDRSQLQKIEKILKYSIPENKVIGFKPVFEPKEGSSGGSRNRGEREIQGNKSRRPSTNAAPGKSDGKKGSGNTRKFRPKRRSR